MGILQNWSDTGSSLLERLSVYKGQEVVVYGLPPAGVMLAKVVADALEAPLDLLFACKIEMPDNPDQAIGAVTDDAYAVFDHAACAPISFAWLRDETDRRIREATQRRSLYLSDRASIDVRGKTVIVVDDGMATGYAFEAALESLRHRHPARIVVAAPVCSKSVVERLLRIVDEVIAVAIPGSLVAQETTERDRGSTMEDRDLLGLKEIAIR